MNFKIRRSILFSVFIIIPVFLSSCLSNVENKFPTQVQIGFEVNYLDSTYTQSTDSIHVEKVRVVHGLSFFKSEGDTLPFNAQLRSYDFNPISPQFFNPVSLFANSFPARTYQALVFFITPASEASTLVDPDFVDGGKYSMIIEGDYNGQSFTFNSKKAFKRSFSFIPPVQAPENNGSYTFVVKTDIREWFVEAGGNGLLDPKISENADGINSNIQRSLRFEQL